MRSHIVHQLQILKEFDLLICHNVALNLLMSHIMNGTFILFVHLPALIDHAHQLCLVLHLQLQISAGGLLNDVGTFFDPR